MCNSVCGRESAGWKAVGVEVGVCVLSMTETDIPITVFVVFPTPESDIMLGTESLVVATAEDRQLRIGSAPQVLKICRSTRSL